MPNLGKIQPEVLVESGDIARINYAGAKVRKPLLAVSDLNGRENPCWFDGEKSYIIPAGSEEIPEIRALIQKVRRKIKMHLENGVFKLRTWKRPSRPFQGQGW